MWARLKEAGKVSLAKDADAGRGFEAWLGYF